MTSSRKRSRRKNSEDDFDDYEDAYDIDEGDSGAKWACQSCTFQNRFGAFRCAMCGTRKGTSTRKARLSDNVVEMQALAIQQVQKEQSLKRNKKSASRKSVEPSGSRCSSVAPSERPDSSLLAEVKNEIKSPEKMNNYEPGDVKIDLNGIKSEFGAIENTEDQILKDVKKEEMTTPKPAMSKMSILSILSNEYKPVIASNINSSTCGPSTSSEHSSTDRQCTSVSSSFGTNRSTSTHISPSASRPSSGTDSSSDISTARSIEANLVEQIKMRMKIPDEKICRNVSKKIVVVANGVPAVFIEYPRRVPGPAPHG